jgi:hypothetical protein
LETFEDTDVHVETTTDESTKETQSPPSNGNNSTLPQPIPVLRQRSDTAENSIDMLSGTDPNGEAQLLIVGEQPPRMPVFVAVGITVSWIFICAALFKLWEASFYMCSHYN